MEKSQVEGIERSGGANYECVDEAVSDGDTSYVYHVDEDVSNQYIDLYNLPAFAAGDDTFNSLYLGFLHESNDIFDAAADADFVFQFPLLGISP